MYRSNSRNAFARALVLSTLVVAMGPAISADVSFEGKTIDIIVSSNPGTSLDTSARLYSQFLSKHLRGSPTIIVKNMPGAGGNRARNFVYDRGAKDGTNLIYAATALQAQVLGDRGIRYDHRKLSIIAALTNLPVLTYMRKSALPIGATDSADIVKAKGLKVGGIRPSSSLDMFPKAALRMLGVPFIYVTGYKGGSGIAKAVRSGEVHIGTTAGSTWFRVIEKSLGANAKALWYYPELDANGKPLPAPEMKGVPSIIDVYKKIHGKDPSGPTWEALKFVLEVRSTAQEVLWGPPGMDKDARDTLRKAFSAMYASKDFQNNFVKVMGKGNSMSKIEDAERAYQALGRFDKGSTQYWIKENSK